MSGRRQCLLVHFDRLKLCPSDIQDVSQDLQQSEEVNDSLVVLQTPSHKLQCGPMAYIPDNDDEESNTEVTAAAPENGRLRQICLWLIYTAVDTAAASEETDVRMSTSEPDLSVDETSSRRYPSQSHQPPTRFDS